MPKRVLLVFCVIPSAAAKANEADTKAAREEAEALHLKAGSVKHLHIHVEFWGVSWARAL